MIRFFVLFSACYLGTLTAQDAHRNVVFIAVDDLAATLGCYGDPIAKTPHIDRLAARGVLFTNAYNQIPLCNPSRASVMTGLRPDQIKVYDLDRHFREEVPDVVTLSQLFKNAGHRTARVGKIYHYNVPASIGTDGFDDPPSWQETFNPYGRDKTDEALIFNAEPHRKISAALSWLAADGTDEEQTDGMIATQATQWIGENKNKPFFLGVGFFRPHTPYVAPKKYFDWYPVESLHLPYAPENDRDDIPTAAFAHNCPVPNYNLEKPVLLKAIQAYYATVSFVDAQIGRIMASLEEQGLLENTVIVFWSDHGYHLGEHGGIWQKRTLFEPCSSAPMIISVPGAKGNGQICRKIVEFVDIYPTVAEAGGQKIPEHCAGRSLLPLLKDPLAEWKNEEAITQILRPSDHRLPQPVMGCSIRTPRWRYTEWADGNDGVELYDYHSDPEEFRNLAINPDATTAAIIKDLQKRLRKKASGKIPETPFHEPRL
ncbi:MAG: sulfatase [Verrucomicrobiales bacterium]|nr:sulfatase [Verrucomicrobiales bacterium]